ncbi:hypothetical protein [Sinorhizobium medicae]|uniref:hypothetical protein n=1 Tax=Sinorhizobium medicae TaxID=110321 RepID=UPI001F215D1E|nr:hypothetical protein [Sinorhizobium medicae]
MTLWGCAFEDFLTQDFEIEGGNVVDEYLKSRGTTPVNAVHRLSTLRWKTASGCGEMWN